ncbi:MAG: hypothetical protein CVV28_02875 [Methanobacteriales archaeon HGW-Methanobacteriales-1]|jgi:hypothetical protein|nr:MAG: hypothetical protein CVV28_02875 [Methanobacteriales archaeon HGW-Methanobacteriales-1]
MKAVFLMNENEIGELKQRIGVLDDYDFMPFVLDSEPEEIEVKSVRNNKEIEYLMSFYEIDKFENSDSLENYDDDDIVLIANILEVKFIDQ